MLYRFIMICKTGLLAATSAAAGVITVHPSLPVKTVNHALQLARAGDTILIKKAWYPVNDLVIDKPVTLLGENYPVLDGQFKGQVLIIRSDNVTVKGLTVCNSNNGSMKNYAGILCDRVRNIRVEDNRLVNTLFPVYLPECNRGIIRGNIITGKSTAITSGSGIYLWHSSRIRIENNRVSGQRDGIYFEFSTGCMISGNMCENNYRYGLHFMFSDSNTYYGNIFRKNGSGVAMMYSSRVKMLQNRFEQNWGAASYGLLLKEISASEIGKNVFLGNTTGIFMESSDRNRFSNNEFRLNGWALRISGDCGDNDFRLNSFTGNTFDVSTNGDGLPNHFEYNYWDKYEGYDLNKDKIGDIPYHPVSLYGILLEQLPYAVMLLHSLMVNLLDKAERSVPSLTPSAVTDNYPLMQYKTP